MNVLQYVDPGPRVFWLFLVVMIQATVVILAAAAVARTALRWSAAARHRVWVWALICVVSGPALVVLGEGAGFTLPVIPWNRAATPGEPAPEMRSVAAPDVVERVAPEEPAPRAAESAEPRIVAAPVDAGDRLAVSVPGATIVPRHDATFRAAMILVWAVGVLTGSCRFAFGWHRARRLLGSLRPLQLHEHAGLRSDLRLVLGDLEPPSFFESAEVGTPVVIGVLRPIVVFPEELTASLAPSELRDVLIHECAHVVRRDTAVGLLQRLAGIVYWIHPLVHLLNVELARAREEVCDNFVLQGSDPCRYARTLLELTERCESRAVACAGMGLMDARWTLRDRVAGLLDPRRITTATSGRRTAAVLGLLLTATSLVIALVRPAAAHHEAKGEPVPELPAAVSAAPDRTIQGIVVDEQDRPVAGAIVRLVRSEKMKEPAQTSADGRFTLQIGGFMLVEEDLVASAEAGSRLGLGKHLEPQNAGAAAPTRIVLKPSRTVTVQVHEQVGKAVAGARVEAIGFHFHGGTTTSQDGRATLRIPADAEVRWIIGLKPGVGFDYFENYRSRPAFDIAAPPADISLTLESARAVRIKAVDSEGRPVPNVAFRPWFIRKPGTADQANLSGSDAVQVRTDGQGIAVFDWLPSTVNEEIPFLIMPGDYSCPVSPVYQPDSNKEELQARLLRATPIRGVVRHRDGRPAAGILLRAEGRGATNHYCRMHTRTGEDGSYSFAVYPEQSYMIAVLDDRQAARSLTGIVVHEGQAREGNDLTLGPGTSVHGWVTRELDGKSPVGEEIALIQKGEPIPKEFISRRGEGAAESLPRWARVDGDGHYQFRVGPGRYELLGPGHAGKEDLRVENELEIVRDFAVALAAQPRTLQGVVIERGPAGERPIAEAIVEASTVGGSGFANRALADREGRFRLRVPSGGVLVLYVRDRAGTIAGFSRATQDDQTLRVAATPGGRIRGRVVDKQGHPRAGRRVQVRLDSGTDYRDSGHFFLHALTDTQGNYDFRGVPVGAKAEVSVSHSEDPEARGPVEVERVDVRSPEPLDLPDLIVPAPAA